MECDCEPNSPCTAEFPCGEKTYSEQVAAELWTNLSSVATALLTVFGYFLYKFSQALPAFIRWPVRIICSLTGLSSLWSWVSRFVSTVRVLQTLWKWMVHLWRFFVALFSKLNLVAVIIKTIAGSLATIFGFLLNLAGHVKGTSKHNGLYTWRSGQVLHLRPHVQDPSLRLILVGPCGAARCAVGHCLLGDRWAPIVLSEKCSSVRAQVDGWDITVVDTPDFLGTSLSARRRAQEALRSLQLAAPGPHAFLFVLPLGSTIEQENAMESLMTLLQLMGKDSVTHVLVVFIQMNPDSRSLTLSQLLEEDSTNLTAVLSACGQTAELIDVSSGCSVYNRQAMSQKLLERVVGMRALKGHYIHELQRREDRIREELLADMTDGLALKLGGTGT